MLFLYIDPATGSMLFTILLGLLGTVLYFLKENILKIKFWLSGGRSKEHSETKEPLLIFSDNKRYWNIFEAICRELNKRQIPTSYLTMSEDDPAFEADLEHLHVQYIGQGNKAFSHLNFLNAKILLSTTPSLDVFQWKRSKHVDYYYHIPHAASDISLYRMFGIDYYDGILLSSHFQERQVRALEEARDLEAKEIDLVGIPYFDSLYEKRKEFEASQAKQTSESHADLKQKTVAIAPSWGKNSLFHSFGPRIISKLLESEYAIIIRPHPQSLSSETSLIAQLQKEFPESTNVHWDLSPDNFETLAKADVLISDFSGVLFDYALVFDKTFLYTDTSFDVSPYDAWSIEEPLWTFSVLEDLGMKLEESQIANIDKRVEDLIESPKFAQQRQKVREEAWLHQGEGAKNVVDVVERKLYTLDWQEERKEKGL